MKNLLCFLLCLTLIFSSVSLCFAAGWSDSQISSVVSDLSTVKTTLNNIYTRLGTIMNYLYDDSHSVAYWASAIASWMQPIYSALTSNLVANLHLDPIIAGLNEVISDGTNTTYYPYLKYGGKSAAQWLSDLNTQNYFPFNASNAGFWNIGANGAANLIRINASSYNWQKILLLYMGYLGDMTANSYSYRWAADLTGYNSSQTALNWNDLDSQYSFTPSSATDGIYKWFATLQAPVARLSYVLASDERIEAQEAAAENEQAVVDNFIDSSGDGATSPSDIGSVSDLSSGYKQNFGSDASPSGIFDIFNSDHATWFSQETKNQLDTTSPTRLTKGSESETPLLDKQIDDIYNALGVKQP